MERKLSLLLMMLFLLMSTITIAQSIFINEIHYDNSGADANEGIEVAGPAGTDLSGWSLVLYNGNGGSQYNTISLTGILANQQSGFGTAFFDAAGLQNGSPDGIALVDPSNAVIQFLSYEGAFTAVDGPASGMMSTDIGVSEVSSTPLNTSMQLAGNGTQYSDFLWETGISSSYNAVNVNQTFGTPVTAAPIINEFVFNHTGSDINEFVELFGDPNTDYSAYTLIEIEGDGSGAGTIDEVINVGTTDGNGFWTTSILSNAFENGTVSVLLVQDFSGALGDDLDTDNDGLLDATPWSSIADAIGVNDGGSSDFNYSNTVLLGGFDGIPFTVGGASRIPNGVGTDSPFDWVRNDFDGQGLPDFPSAIADGGEAINTPGAENTVASGPVADILINELDADTESTDIAEFIELYDGGLGNTSLDGLVLVFFNGSNDLSYRTIDLSGFATDMDGYFVLGNSGVPNVSIVFPSNGLQNGADAVVLYAGSASDYPNGSSISLDNIVDAVVYDTNDSDDAELLALLNPGEPQLNEDMNGQKDTESLQRIPNGDGGARNTSSFSAASPTPGTENGAITPPPGPITIAEARATAEGESVTVRGVLTVAGQFGGPAYIQDSTGGIAVFDAQIHDNPAFEVGDSVEISGVRSSFNDQVQLGGLTVVTDLGVANAPIVPRPVTLSQLSGYPGELVVLTDVSFPTPDDLLFGNSNYLVSDVSGSGELRLDADVIDLVGKAQPEICETVTGVVGRFRTIYQLLPRQAGDLPCARPYEPEGDDLTIPKSATFDIVTWNIEWFGDENNSPAPNDNVQKDSVKTILMELDADVIAVQEITDVDLFSQMISELPGYDFILSDFVSRPNDSGAKQRVGFIYKTQNVQPDFDATKALLASIHPLYNGGDDSFLVGYPSTTDRFYASGRLPFMLVADVTIDGTTQKLHLVNLHARANSGSDAQNRYDMRKYDVEVLKDTLDAQYSDVNLILLGDYNDDVDETVADIPSTLTSYEVFVNDTEGYTIATEVLSNEGFRSFVFRENMIDHITISNELDDELLASSARVGYEFYDADYTESASDHFPVSLRLDFINGITTNIAKAVEVVEFDQGKRKNGRPVVWWRSVPEKALGEPLENWYFNFVSLGFGGSITLKLDTPLYDLAGKDFMVYESTFGPFDIPCEHYPEKAEVLVSSEGNDFISVGQSCLDGKFDLADAGIRTARYIKITDLSDPADFRGGNADGYDLDGIWPLMPMGDPNARSTQELLVDEGNYAPNEEGETLLDVYPNPFRRSLNVSWFSERETALQVNVYNVNGQKVYQTELKTRLGANELNVDLGQLNSGIYLMEVTNIQVGQKQTYKLFKE